MQYRNVRTGAVIETPCAVAGKDWERVDKPAPKAQEPTVKKRAERKKATEK